MDGHMLEATPKDKRCWVGEITNVNIRPITDVLEGVYPRQIDSRLRR